LERYLVKRAILCKIYIMPYRKGHHTGHVVCTDCHAACCRNLAIIIGRPQNKEELEDLKWQLHFDTVRVYIRSKRWYLLVEGTCRYLGKDNRCTVYEHRPDRCRVYNPPDCEYYGEFYDIMLNTPEELETYYYRNKKKTGKKKR